MKSALNTVENTIDSVSESIKGAAKNIGKGVDDIQKVVEKENNGW